MRKSAKGFTLIEVMITVGIIGILAAMVAGKIQNKNKPHPSPDTSAEFVTEFGQGVYYFNTSKLNVNRESAAVGKGLADLLMKNPGSKISTVTPLVCTASSNCGYWVTLEKKER